MNDDTSQKLERTGWGIIKGTAWFVGVFAIFGAIFWALFYSSYFANITFVITLRNWYQDTYWKAEGLVFKPVRKFPPFNPIYTIQAQKPTDGNTYYSLWGTFQSADPQNGIIKVKGFNNRIYNFLVGNNWANINNGSLTLVPIPVSDVFFEKVIINVDSSPYSSISFLWIQWDDTRSLIQIEADYSSDQSIPLNQSSKHLFGLLKFN